MGKGKKKGGGAKKTPQIAYISNMELWPILREKLTLAERKALDRAMSNMIENALKEMHDDVLKELYMRNWAVFFRILKDRFEFSDADLLKVHENAMSYLKDIEDGVMTTDEIIAGLAKWDNVNLAWSFEENEKG